VGDSGDKGEGDGAHFGERGRASPNVLVKKGETNYKLTGILSLLWE